MQVCSDEYEEIGQKENENIENLELEEEKDHIDQVKDDELLSCFFEKWKKNTTQYLNDNDDDEKLEDRFYIISIDGIPYFYEKSLVNARTKMWNIANTMLKTTNDSNLQILSSNINEIKIVSPYQFFILNYNHILFHFTIDYVLPIPQ